MGLKLPGFFGKRLSEREKKIAAMLRSGFFVRPKRMELYLTALRHKSASKNLYNGEAESNERLEFLGDAILDAVVAHYLYDKYPHSEEGDLTKMKSRIVSRTTLNSMANAAGIQGLLETDAQAAQAVESIAGNALEAIFGAIYCDLGYARCRKSILKMLEKQANLNALEDEEADFKSRIYELAHKKKVDIQFKTVAENEKKGRKTFVSIVYFDGESFGFGKGSSKKKAEQQASAEALKKLSPD